MIHTTTKANIPEENKELALTYATLNPNTDKQALTTIMNNLSEEQAEAALHYLILHPNLQKTVEELLTQNNKIHNYTKLYAEQLDAKRIPNTPISAKVALKGKPNSSKCTTKENTH